jgi:hypothetical protein
MKEIHTNNMTKIKLKDIEQMIIVITKISSNGIQRKGIICTINQMSSLVAKEAAKLIPF